MDPCVHSCAHPCVHPCPRPLQTPSSVQALCVPCGHCPRRHHCPTPPSTSPCSLAALLAPTPRYILAGKAGSCKSGLRTRTRRMICIPMLLFPARRREARGCLGSAPVTHSHAEGNSQHPPCLHPMADACGALGGDSACRSDGGEQDCSWGVPVPHRAPPSSPSPGLPPARRQQGVVCNGCNGTLPLAVPSLTDRRALMVTSSWKYPWAWF